MKKILCAVGLSFLLLGSATNVLAAAAPVKEGKVAIVDVREILHSMPDRELVAKKLEKEFDERGKALQAEQKTAQANMEKLQKESLTLSAAQKKKLEDAVNKFEDKAKAFSDDFRRRDNEETNKLLEKIHNAVQSIAKKNNYVVVLNSEAAFYADDANDITQQVLTQVSK